MICKSYWTNTYERIYLNLGLLNIFDSCKTSAKDRTKICEAWSTPCARMHRWLGNLFINEILEQIEWNQYWMTFCLPTANSNKVTNTRDCLFSALAAGSCRLLRAAIIYGRFSEQHPNNHYLQSMTMWMIIKHHSWSNRMEIDKYIFQHLSLLQ